MQKYKVVDYKIVLNMNENIPPEHNNYKMIRREKETLTYSFFLHSVKSAYNF